MTGEKRRGLIQLDGIKQLIEGGEPFRVRYDYAGMTQYGQPRFHAIYEGDLGGPHDEYLLITTRKSPEGGFQPHVFSLWPGLFKHHRLYGGDGVLCISKTWDVEVITPDELADLQKCREGRRRADS